MGNLGANVAKYGGALTAAGGMFSLDAIALIFGMVCAGIGVVAGVYYKHKEYKLKELYYKNHGVKLEDVE